MFVGGCRRCSGCQLGRGYGKEVLFGHCGVVFGDKDSSERVTEILDAGQVP